MAPVSFTSSGNVVLLVFPMLGSSNARGCSVIPVLVPAPPGVPFSLGDGYPDLQESWDGPDGEKGTQEEEDMYPQKMKDIPFPEMHIPE